jgi:hypothetical protein
MAVNAFNMRYSQKGFLSVIGSIALGMIMAYEPATRL